MAVLQGPGCTTYVHVAVHIEVSQAKYGTVAEYMVKLGRKKSHCKVHAGSAPTSSITKLPAVIFSMASGADISSGDEVLDRDNLSFWAMQMPVRRSGHAGWQDIGWPGMLLFECLRFLALMEPMCSRHPLLEDSINSASIFTCPAYPMAPTPSLASHHQA